MDDVLEAGDYFRSGNEEKAVKRRNNLSWTFLGAGKPEMTRRKRTQARAGT